jgi:hypothetical protein
MALYEAVRADTQPLLELSGNRITAAIIVEDYWLLLDNFLKFMNKIFIKFDQIKKELKENTIHFNRKF